MEAERDAVVRNKLYYALGWFVSRLLPFNLYNKVFKLAKKFSLEGTDNVEKGSGKVSKVINKEIKNLLNNRKNIVMEKPMSNLSELDLSKTKAFLDQKWGITIIKKNVRNYESFRSKLVKELAGVKDSKGNRVFKAVYKKEQVHKGRYLGLVPDIVFLFNKEFEARKGFSSRVISRIRVKRYFNSRVWGAHENARKGIFMAYGPDIQKGKRLKPISILDLAPTVLHMMNKPVPAELEGKVINMFTKDSWLGKQKIKYAKKEKKEGKKQEKKQKEKDMIKSLMASGRIRF